MKTSTCNSLFYATIILNQFPSCIRVTDTLWWSLLSKKKSLFFLALFFWLISNLVYFNLDLHRSLTWGNKQLYVIPVSWLSNTLGNFVAKAIRAGTNRKTPICDSITAMTLRKRKNRAETASIISGMLKDVVKSNSGD